ncbi:MAG: hypothetical protein HYT49_01180 [Candidatus Wildermuthbacteria bacterium]|nr:hypothetical protein [Candidatus Wildermuthbacteria bacterium]
MHSGCFSKAHEYHTSESGLIPLLVLVGLGIGSAVVLALIGGVTDCSPTDFACMGIAIAAGIVKVVATVLAEAAEFIYGGVASVLQWVVRNMLSIPVAPGAPGITPVVTEGWELSRSFVNAILLLILVFIGLATILRFREYEIQRTLPRLIIVALLVNFSGILVGLVVDIANIIANFFFGAVSKVSWAVPWPGASGITGSGLAQIVASSLGILLYYIIAIFIYFAFIALMFTRTFVLWTLAILAPLAFAASILPATRSYWNRWLSTLLHWAFIPVPIGFFLYLAGFTLVNSAGSAFDPAFSRVESNPIVAFISPFLALFLLFAGLTLTAFGGPMRSIGRFAKKAATIGAGFLAAQAIMRAAESKKVRSTIEKGAVSESPRWGYDKTTGAKSKGFGSAVARGFGGIAGYGRRTAYGVAQNVVVEKEKEREEKIRQKARGKDAVGLMHDLRQAGSESDRAAILSVAAAEGKLRTMMNADAMGGKGNVLKPDEIMKARLYAEERGNSDLQDAIDRGFVAAKTGSGKKVRSAKRDDEGNLIIDPTTGDIDYEEREELWSDRFADIKDRVSQNAIDPKDRTYGGYSEEDVERGLISKKEFDNLKADVQAVRAGGTGRGLTGNYGAKVVTDATSAGDIKQLQKGWWKDKQLMEAAHKFWKGNQVDQAAREFGREFINSLEQNKKKGDWYFGIDKETGKPRNIAMARYEVSSSAQGLGIAPKEGAESTDDVSKRSRIANLWAGQYGKKAPVPGAYQELQKVMALEQKVADLESYPVSARTPTQQAALQAMQAQFNQMLGNLKDKMMLDPDPEIRELWEETEKAQSKLKPKP